MSRQYQNFRLLKASLPVASQGSGDPCQSHQHGTDKIGQSPSGDSKLSLSPAETFYQAGNIFFGDPRIRLPDGVSAGPYLPPAVRGPHLRDPVSNKAAVTTDCNHIANGQSADDRSGVDLYRADYQPVAGSECRPHAVPSRADAHLPLIFQQTCRNTGCLTHDTPLPDEKVVPHAAVRNKLQCADSHN